MRCAHLFGRSLRLGMPSISPCKVDFIFLFMVLDPTDSKATNVVVPGEMLENFSSILESDLDADYLPLVIYH